MARIRTIKPSFFTSLTVADLSIEARLTFIGLWTHCDDEGRCIYDPRLLKAAIWPLDDRTAADIAADITTIVAAGLVTHYTFTEPAVSPHGAVRTTSYLSVNGWAEHQRINRPSDSHLPSPDEGEIMPPTSPNGPGGGITEDAVRDHARNKEGNREGNGVGAVAPRRAEPAAPPLPIPASETEGQRVNRLTKAYTDRVPLSKFPAIAGVVRQAVRASDDTGRPKYGDDQVTQALIRLAGEGRSVTVDSLRYELEGFPRSVASIAPRPSTTDARVRAALEAGAEVQAMLDARRDGAA